jgi:hypothetical protein
MSELHSTLVDGLAGNNSEKWRKVALFRMVKRHFKMHLCNVKPVQEMVYGAIAAPARAPFGRSSAISVRMHASEIQRRRRLSPLSRFTWDTATIGGLNVTGSAGREGTVGQIANPSHDSMTSLSVCPFVPRPEGRDSRTLGQPGKRAGGNRSDRMLSVKKGISPINYGRRARKHPPCAGARRKKG